MTPPTQDDQLSFLRVVEFALAVIALAVLAGAWGYSWWKGSLLAGFWYGG